MTIRWNSDVPSKIVKIVERGTNALRAATVSLAIAFLADYLTQVHREVHFPAALTESRVPAAAQPGAEAVMAQVAWALHDYLRGKSTRLT
jgi:hypothetical protein